MMKTVHRVSVILLLMVVAMSPAGDALAALSNTMGAGAKATSLGGAFTAIADDFSATYYNPAGLATVKHREAASGWLFGNSSVNLSDPANNFEKQISGVVLGNVFPFEMLGIKASLGLYNFWPKNGSRILRISTAPLFFSGQCEGNCGGLVSSGGRGVNLRIPRRLPSSVYLSEDQQEHLDFLLGLGLRLSDYLYVGTAVRANLQIKGTVNADFTLTSKGQGPLAPSPPGGSQFLGQISAEPTFGWIVGGLIDTQKGVRIGLTWRQEIRTQFRQNLVSRTTLPTTDDLSIVIPVTGRLSVDTFFQPQEVSFGVAVDVGKKWMFTAQLDWQEWSRYRGNELFGSFQGIQSFEVPPNQGQSGAGTITFLPKVAPAMRNIWIQRYGVQYQMKRVFRIRAGWARIPSVVNDPGDGVSTAIRDANKNIIAFVTDEPNFADSDKQIFSIGLGLEQDDPFEWFELPATIDFTYQFIKMQDRHFKTHNTNNPFGNFTIQGDQWIMWLTNTARF